MKVQVYIYDLSMGISAQLSVVFLGKAFKPFSLLIINNYFTYF